MLSQLTTVKLSQAHATRPSSCGTPSPSASTPSKKMVTPIGSRAFVSRQIRSIQSLSAVAGIAPLRSGIWQIASWSWTIMDTMDTWTPSLSRPMDHCALPVARTARLCCGIWMMASTCTLWTITTSLMPCASHQTATGCVSLTDHQLRFGIWHARRWLRNFVLEFLEMTHQRPIHHSACHSPGQLMAKLCSLVIATTRFVYGKFQSLLVKYQARDSFKHFQTEIIQNKVWIWIYEINFWSFILI